MYASGQIHFLCRLKIASLSPRFFTNLPENPASLLHFGSFGQKLDFVVGCVHWTLSILGYRISFGSLLFLLLLCSCGGFKWIIHVVMSNRRKVERRKVRVRSCKRNCILPTQQQYTENKIWARMLLKKSRKKSRSCNSPWQNLFNSIYLITDAY